MDVVRFGPESFDPVDSEQFLRVVLARGRTLPDLRSFRSACLRALVDAGDLAVDCVDEYAHDARWESISEEKFSALIGEWTSRLRSSSLRLALQPSTGFRSAAVIYGDWNDVFAVAEYQDEFIGLHWETTA